MASTSTSPSTTYDFTLNKGEDTTLRWAWKGDGENVTDLSSYAEAELRLREPQYQGAIVQTLSVQSGNLELSNGLTTRDDGTLYNIKLIFTAQNTLAVESRTLAYELRLVAGDGIIIKPITGMLTLLDSIEPA